MQKKAHEVEAWLAKPDPRIAVVLVYGPDRGLVSERARRFAERSGVPLDDPFSVVRLDAENDGAGRLAEEAGMISMFAPRRLIWVRNGGNAKPFLDALAALCVKPPGDAIAVVEAGDIKKGTALRTLVEDSPHGIALPSFADEGRAIDGLIDEEMRRAKLSIEPEAREALRDRLGGDRLASRGEIEKLALYAAGRSTITADDVRAVTGDVSGDSADEIVECVASGNGVEAARLFTLRITAANQVQPLLAAALRHFQALHAVRSNMDGARQSASSAVAKLRPPVRGPRAALIERAATRWNLDQLESALEVLQKAVLESRRRGELALAIAERALLNLARMVARR